MEQANPFLSQIRWQAGAAVYGKHEVGLLGAQALNTDSTYNGHLQFRAISHASLYYRYPFENGAEVLTWVGLPYEGSLAHQGGKAGSFVSGVRASVPISGNFSLYAEGAYMKSQRDTGGWAAMQNVETVSMGISYGFGGQPNTNGRNMPLIPVANNGTFMTDASNGIN